MEKKKLMRRRIVVTRTARDETSIALVTRYIHQTSNYCKCESKQGEAGYNQIISLLPFAVCSLVFHIQTEVGLENVLKW